jgi:hypothetical protein
MEDAIEGTPQFFCRDEKILKPLPVGQFPLDKFHASRQKIAPTMAQVVKYNGLMPISGQQFRNCPTNVPRATCNEYLHKKTTSFRTVWYSLKSITEGMVGAAWRRLLQTVKRDG